MDIKFHQNWSSHFQNIMKKLKKYCNKVLMFVDRYVPKTNHFVKLMVGFQFHFNRCNGVEKIVDKKTITSLHTSARTK